MSYHSQNNYRIKLPFNRYYAEENKAPKIEALIWQDRQNEREFYADVRVKDGYGVIEELYVEGVPILDYLKQTQWLAWLFNTDSVNALKIDHLKKDGLKNVICLSSTFSIII